MFGVAIDLTFRLPRPQAPQWTGVESLHARPGSDQLVAVAITIARNHVFNCIGHLVGDSTHAILDPLCSSSDVILYALSRASGVVASFVQLVTRIAGAIGRGCPDIAASLSKNEQCVAVPPIDRDRNTRRTFRWAYVREECARALAKGDAGDRLPVRRHNPALRVALVELE